MRIGSLDTVDLETAIAAQPDVRSNVVTIVEKWESLEALNEHLVSAPIVMRSVAAAALADMKTEEAMSALIAAVFDPGTPRDTRWALTDALAASFEGLGPDGYHKALEVLDRTLER